MKIKSKVISTISALVLSLSMPMAVLADTADPATTPTSDPTQQTTTEVQPSPAAVTPPPAPVATPAPAPAPVSTPETAPQGTPTGPNQPTGADSIAYKYNPATGKWESDKYIWDPITKQTSPKSDPGYYYNPATGKWDTNNYVYSPVTGRYEVAQAPTLAAGLGAGSPLLAGLSASDPLAALLGLSNTGPDSTNTGTIDNNNKGIFDLFSRAAITNNLSSSATSGDASVSGNTNAGSALTGAATAIANLLNLLNSAWSWAAGGLNYFVQNLFGDHTGDINLQFDPANGGGGQVGSLPGGSVSNNGTGPNSTNNGTINNNNDLQVKNQTSGAINNNVNLLAQSGNAAVTGNTNGGSATSGDATALLNLLNLINASIGSGQSFFGLVNIFGNLNGDILFPQGFLNSATPSSAVGSGGNSASASNTGPNSTNNGTINNNNNLDLNNTANAAFNNNINANAQSGNATVSGNTSAGSATTGQANTNSNLFNLFNSNVVGENAVLVLVNVMGHWVGGIMNLPGGGGNSSGLLTGNASVSNSNTGPDSSNNASVNNNNDLSLNNNASGTINNNINVGAQSGDATVSHNTKAGDATSGDAKVASNVANIFNSTLNLSKWFGVLVINVFGDWTGSVNKDTDAGNSAGVSASNQSLSSSGSNSNPTVVRHSSSGATTVSSGGGAGSSSSVNGSATGSKILSAKQKATEQAVAQTKNVSLLMILGSAMMLLIGAGLYGVDRRLRARTG